MLPAFVFVLTSMGLLLVLAFFLCRVNPLTTLLDVGKALKLAAPQCIACFGVRLDLQRIAPFLGFLLGRVNPLTTLLDFRYSPQISCPTMHCPLWCSS